jgi:Na+-translocating membrane potential-generating system (MpsC)
MPQTEVEQSLVAEGEVDAVELLRRRVRRLAADEFCATTEEVVGRKVLVMLGDHNAIANVSALVFLLEPDRE